MSALSKPFPELEGEKRIREGKAEAGRHGVGLLREDSGSATVKLSWAS